MKILFLLSIGFDKIGPSVHLVKDIIESALIKGHKCHIVLKKTAETDINGLEDLTQKYKELSFSLIEDIADKRRGFIGRYIHDCKYAFKCRRHYKNQKFDVVFMQSNNVPWVHILGLRSLKCPVVYNVQDIFPYNLKFSNQLPFEKITFPVFRKFQNIAYKKAARIITISDDMKQTLVKDGIPSEKIEVVYNWSYGDEDIKLEQIADDCLFPLNKDEGKLNVVYAGNIGKMQNVETVAKCAALTESNPEIHYYIIGDGANKAHIEEMTVGLKNVTMLPMQQSKFAESIYAQADVNIIPLTRGGIFTALPSKTATCLRVGKPIVFCIDKNSEFYSLMENEENIYLCDCDDDVGLANILKNIFTNVKKIYTASQNTRDLITVKNAQKYVVVLEKSVL